MKEKMVVLKFIRIENALGKPLELWHQPLCPHQVRELDVIKAVVIRQVGGGKLDPCHAGKKVECPPE